MGSQRVRHATECFTFFHFAPFVLEFIFHTCDSSFSSPGAWSPCDQRSMPHQRTWQSCHRCGRLRITSWLLPFGWTQLFLDVLWASGRLLLRWVRLCCSIWSHGLSTGAPCLTPGFVWVMGTLSPSTSPCTLGDLAMLFCFLHTQPDGARICEAVLWSQLWPCP